MSTAALPKYRQIANHFRDQILSGELRPGDEIPSERTLATRFSVSRPTATKVLELLRREGFAESVQGSGTYVADLGVNRLARVGLLHEPDPLAGVRSRKEDLPTFEQIIDRGIAHVTEALDWLRSDWSDEPSGAQGNRRADGVVLLGRAKAVLERAKRG